MNKMTKIFFVRHAQSDLSVKDDKMRPLTEKGMADSCKVSEILAKENIAQLFSSPFKRAVDTLKPFAEMRNLDIQLIDGLKERRVSTGWLWMDDFMEFSKKQWKDFSYKLKGGESLGEIRDRNIAVINDILKKYQGENIAIGTHGTAMSTIIDHFTGNFGFEGFQRIVKKMPHIVCLKFKGVEFIEMTEIDVKSGWQNA